MHLLAAFISEIYQPYQSPSSLEDFFVQRVVSLALDSSIMLYSFLLLLLTL